MTFKIAFCSNQSNPYYNEVLRGAAEALKHCDHAILMDFNDQQRFPLKALEILHPDGILVGPTTKEDYQKFFPNLPAIGFSNAMETKFFPSVVNDDLAAGRQAARALVDAGYQQILILKFGLNHYISLRADGAESYAREQNVPVERLDLTFRSAHNGEKFQDIWEKHIQTLRKRISSLSPGTGVISAEPRMAGEVLTLSADGEAPSIPDQLGLVLADLPEDSEHRPAYVRLAGRTIGAKAAELLVQNLLDPNTELPPLTHIPPTGVHPGDTLPSH